MRLIAQQSVQPAERDAQTGLMPSVAYDGIRLQIPRPTRPGAKPRRGAVAPIDQLRFDESRDLAPARGAVTAIGIGTVLWVVIALAVRALLA